jgi:hypothetical protein
MPATEDRRAREASALAEHVAQAVAAAPPLTTRQITRLATLLNPTPPTTGSPSTTRGAA